MDWVGQFFDGPFYTKDYEAVDRDTERTAREVEFIISELGLGADDVVLDLACGSGRHALQVAQHVKQVVGIDRTKMCIDKAQSLVAASGLENVEFQIGDMRELDYDAHFTAAYNYFTAWGYYDHETNIDVLRRVRRSLKRGGRFLLEIINRDAIMATWRPRDFSLGEDGTVTLYERRFDFATGRAHSTYTRIDGSGRSAVEIDHYMPTGDALVRHFAEAGFRDVRLVPAPLAESGLNVPKVITRKSKELTLMNRRMAVSGSA
jgi:ubiquinone/menaquinone biosynthesis C-methylase UbiE